jgi:hypothetical protein
LSLAKKSLKVRLILLNDALDASILVLSALLTTLAPPAELSAPPPEKNKIRRPPGQAGRKTTTRSNGKPRYGFDLQEAMGLKGTAEKKKLYLDIRVSSIVYSMLHLTTARNSSGMV